VIVIHHIEGRRSERVAWLCEELGLPYELSFVSGDIMASLLALTPVHVMRMAPIVDDGDVRIVESGAILEYVLARYGEGRLRPATDAPGFADYLQWMHFAEGSGMARLGMERLVNQLGGPQPAQDVAYLYLSGSERVLKFAEAALARAPWFAGEEFTAADIMMHFPMRMAGLVSKKVQGTAPLFRGDRSGLEDYPHINGFLDRVAARPAYQRAVATTMPNGPPPR
jgi:glutathione S-transferase